MSKGEEVCLNYENDRKTLLSGNVSSKTDAHQNLDGALF